MATYSSSSQYMDHHHHVPRDDNNLRLVARNLPFYQSKNRYQMMTKSSISKNEVWRLRYYFDLFHVLIRQQTWISLSVLLITWTGFIILFSGLYYAVDHANPDVQCGLGRAGKPLTYRASFAFSLQTCTTVGYTLPSGSNAFFENCPELQIVIYFQMILSMLFNGIFFAFLYTRIARSDNRGVQVMFSDKAIISIHDVIPSLHSPTSYYNMNNKQQVRFQVRIYDVSSNSSPVVEAHVRIYAVMKKKEGNHVHNPTPIPLRILQPNDQFNSMLFLSIPSVVSHHIDLYSKLHPPTPTTISNHTTSSLSHLNNLPFRTLKHGLHLRQADSRSGSREDVLCPICGESYGTIDRLIKHIRYNQIIEKHDEWDENDPASHLSIHDAEEYMNMLPQPNRNVNDIRQHFAENISEIIVIVEGIEPTVSGSFSALHSYCYDDIIFHPTASFQPCLLRHHYANNNKAKLMVDLNRFHSIAYTHGNRDSVHDGLHPDLNDTTAAYDVIPGKYSLHQQVLAQQAPHMSMCLSTPSTAEDIRNTTMATSNVFTTTTSLGTRTDDNGTVDGDTTSASISQSLTASRGQSSFRFADGVLDSIKE
jgi:Inward rectifier potassium channel transmembrane domain